MSAPRHVGWLLTIAIAAASWGGAVSAAVMRAVFAGTVAPGAVDGMGLFDAGTDLGGLHYELGFVYRTYRPDITFGHVTTPVSEEAFGGAFYQGEASPIVESWIRINDRTATAGGTWAGRARTASDGPLGSTLDFAADDIGPLTRYLHASARGLSGTFPARLATKLPLTELVAGSGYPNGTGYFFFNDFDAGLVTEGDLEATSVRIAPVPVPGAIALLASGLASLALVARRRRSEA